MGIKKLQELKDLLNRVRDQIDKEAGLELKDAVDEAWKKVPRLQQIRVFFDTESDTGAGPDFIDRVRIRLTGLTETVSPRWTWDAGTLELEADDDVPESDLDFKGKETVEALCAVIEFFPGKMARAYDEEEELTLERPEGV